MRTVFCLCLCLVGLVFSSAPTGAQCAPETLLKIVTVDSSPDVEKGSFAAAPKTLYRLGARYARIEEEADPANGIHGLIVISQPDSWIVNLSDRTGRHIVDPDKDGVVRASAIPYSSLGPSFPEVLKHLEYGCEVEFYEKHKAPVATLKTPEGAMVKQALGVGEWMSVLLRKSEDSPPLVLFLLRGDKIVFAVRYVAYEEASVFPGIFSRPAGITFSEAGGL